MFPPTTSLGHDLPILAYATAAGNCLASIADRPRGVIAYIQLPGAVAAEQRATIAGRLRRRGPIERLQTEKTPRALEKFGGTCR